MALRRTLSLRSLLNPRRHQPSSCSFITRHEEKLDCQRSFSSSILYHRPRHSSDSLYPQLLVSLSVIIATCRLLVFLAQTRNADSVVQHVVASLTTAREKLVDALQQLFETVHSLTGFNWWASILLTTFLIRGLTIPAMIHMARFYSVATTLYFSWQKRKQTWMEIKDQHGGAPASYATSQKEIYKVVNNHMSSLTSLLALSLNLITPPIVIDMGKAVAQMTEKVPSLTTGGALWFTDLTRPDALYIFPILTGVLFWITVEALKASHSFCEKGWPVYGHSGDPVDNAFVAVHFYMMSSMLFTIAFVQVLKRPGVKPYLGILEYPESLALQLRYFKRKMKK